MLLTSMKTSTAGLDDRNALSPIWGLDYEWTPRILDIHGDWLSRPQSDEPLALKQFRYNVERGYASNTAGSTRLVAMPYWTVRWLGTAMLVQSDTPDHPLAKPGLERELQRVPASPFVDAIHWIKEHTGLPQDRVAQLLGVRRQTLHRWERGEEISDGNRQRILATKDILERAWANYPTTDELRAWLDTPRDIDGHTPAAMLGKGDVDRARFYAISKRTPILRNKPEWARRSVREALAPNQSERQDALKRTREEEIEEQAHVEWGDEDEYDYIPAE